MKLRETLTDNGKNGTSITYPDGISIFPNNGLWAFLIWFSLIGIIVSVIMCFDD